MLEQIFITGAVTSGGAERAQLYSKLAEVCKPYTQRLHSPLDAMAFRGSNEERYRQAMKWISTSNLLIAEATFPSTGQGIEIQEACRNNIPIIVLAEKGSKVSSVVLGIPVLREVIYYESVGQVLQALDERLQNFLKPSHSQ
jgi:hypothetical protein